MAKKNTVKQAYYRERNRILRRIREYRKRGIEVDISIPNIPKRITRASTRRLQKIDLAYIRRHSYVPDVETGERRSYTRGFKQYQSYLKLRAETPSRAGGKEVPPTSVPLVEILPISEADYIIKEFFNHIAVYPPKAQEIAMDWLQKILSNIDDHELIADMLQQGKESGNWLSPSKAYKHGFLQQNLSEMLDYLEVSGGEKAKIISELDEWDEYYS